MDAITLKSGTIFRREDGLLEFDIAQDVEINEDCAKSIVQAVSKLSQRKLPLFIKSESHSLSFEAMHILSQASNISAAAMAVSNSIQEQTGDYFIKSMQPNYPMKIFFNENEALQWLKKYK